MKKLLRSNSGMSLLNVIILLMLVGVLTTAGVKMMGPLIQRGKINDTKTTINSAVDAISAGPQPTDGCPLRLKLGLSCPTQTMPGVSS